MPIWGPGSDRWGRRRTFLVGIVVFTVGSALCAVSRTMVEFIAARAVQGIGAGAVATLPFVLLGVVYPPEKRGRALGAASTAWAIASVAGPLLGTLIVTHVSWRWAFLINVPIAIVAAFLVIAGMRESIGQSVGRFDLAGALLAGAGGSALMWAFVDLGEGKIGLIQAALIAAGIILLAVFVWHEGRTPHPILPLSFFRHAGYAASTSSSFLAFFSGFGLSSYLPLATNTAFHENRAIVGLVVGAFTIGWSAFAFGTGRLVHRIGERLPCMIGIVCTFSGCSCSWWHLPKARLGRRRGARVRRRHGIALARADRGGAEQRARGPHGQRDDRASNSSAGRRGTGHQRVRVSRDRRQLSRRAAADDRRQRRSIRMHPGAACAQPAHG
jgi:MFS family permease